MRNRLKELRTQRGLTLEQLAERSGYGLSTIGNFENGKTDASQRLIDAVADVLKVRPSDILLSGQAPPKNQSENEESELSSQEAALLNEMRQLEPKARSQVLASVRQLVDLIPKPRRGAAVANSKGASLGEEDLGQISASVHQAQEYELSTKAVSPSGKRSEPQPGTSRHPIQKRTAQAKAPTESES